MKPRIGILTFARDAHAWALKERLEQRHRAFVHIIGIDRVASSDSLHWSAQGGELATLPTACGSGVAVADLHAIWDRRVGVTPQVGVDDEDLQDQVDQDCDTALDGLLASEFQGRWVSPPDAARAARNPLLQLRVAAASGLKVPSTIVSQDPEEVRDFCARHPAIVRGLRGGAATPVDPALLADDEAIRLAPAIYQAKLSGTRQLRVYGFGERRLALLVDGEWRTGLNTPVVRHRLDPATGERLRLITESLRLRMAVVDLQLDDAGEPTFVELKPQGSFLWLEGLSGTPLLDACGDLLLAEARHPDVTRRTSQRDARRPASWA
jgi:hypothetical protein